MAKLFSNAVYTYGYLGYYRPDYFSLEKRMCLAESLGG